MARPPEFYDVVEAIGFIIPQLFDTVSHLSIQEIPDQHRFFVVHMDFDDRSVGVAIWDSMTSTFFESSA